MVIWQHINFHVLHGVLNGNEEPENVRSSSKTFTHPLLHFFDYSNAYTIAATTFWMRVNAEATVGEIREKEIEA